MNHLTALVIAVVILAVFALDALVFQWNLPVLIGREMLRLLDLMAVWR